MLVRDFDYHLPEELIAQSPLADRAASRLLHLDRATGREADRTFRDLPALLRPDDLLVFNDTRVFPARLFGRRSGARSQPISPNNPAAKDFLQGRIEVLLTKQLPDVTRNEKPETRNLTWQALVRPGRKIGIGEKLSFANDLHAEVIARGEFGERTLRFEPVVGHEDPDFFAALERVGHIPLPPYIARPDSAADRERYQTVYARKEDHGSVAAPTAGLHFTPEILDLLRARGIETANITLHVGLGTFQPIHAERVEDHKLHTETYSIPEEAAAQINGALAAKRRVVAVGTTTVRTLEFVAARNDGKIIGGSAEADIFIYPGFPFRVTGALLTNFHLPQSTLLMLVAAFAGRDHTLAAYAHAVREKYRFYSYGDCMLIE